MNNARYLCEVKAWKSSRSSWREYVGQRLRPGAGKGDADDLVRPTESDAEKEPDDGEQLPVGRVAAMVLNLIEEERANVRFVNVVDGLGDRTEEETGVQKVVASCGRTEFTQDEIVLQPFEKSLHEVTPGADEGDQDVMQVTGLLMGSNRLRLTSHCRFGLRSAGRLWA